MGRESWMSRDQVKTELGWRNSDWNSEDKQDSHFQKSKEDWKENSRQVWPHYVAPWLSPGRKRNQVGGHKGPWFLTKELAALSINALPSKMGCSHKSTLRITLHLRLSSLPPSADHATKAFLTRQSIPISVLFKPQHSWMARWWGISTIPNITFSSFLSLWIHSKRVVNQVCLFVYGGCFVYLNEGGLSEKYFLEEF